jgi:branched-chain amino acid transport system permease protein
VTAWYPPFVRRVCGGARITATTALLVWCLIPAWLAFAITDRFTDSVLALASVQALYAASWDLLGGVTGQLSLGHALHFGCGAYLTAILAGLLRVPPIPALTAAAGGGVLLGALQGMFARHLRPAFLALVTLALAECAHELSGMLQVPGPGGLGFGGEGGIPSPLFPADEFGAARLAAAALIAGVTGFVWVARSNLGLAMRTARADPQAAAISGIDVGRIRLIAFILSGAGAGFAGGLTAGFVGRASPSMLSLDMSLFAVAAAVLGRSGTILGPAAAAYLLTAALQWVELSTPLRLTLYGIILVAAGLAAPGSTARFGAFLLRPSRHAGLGS